MDLNWIQIVENKMAIIWAVQKHQVSYFLFFGTKMVVSLRSVCVSVLLGNLFNELNDESDVKDVSAIQGGCTYGLSNQPNQWDNINGIGGAYGQEGGGAEQGILRVFFCARMGVSQ